MAAAAMLNLNGSANADQVPSVFFAFAKAVAEDQVVSVQVEERCKVVRRATRQCRVTRRDPEQGLIYTSTCYYTGLHALSDPWRHSTRSRITTTTANAIAMVSIDEL